MVKADRRLPRGRSGSGGVALPELVALAASPRGVLHSGVRGLGWLRADPPDARRRSRCLCGFGLVQPELSVLVMLFPFNDSWKRGTGRSPPDPVP